MCTVYTWHHYCCENIWTTQNDSKHCNLLPSLKQNEYTWQFHKKLLLAAIKTSKSLKFGWLVSTALVYVQSVHSRFPAYID